MGGVKSLGDFILEAQVMRLYRQYMKVAYSLPLESRLEVKTQVAAAFRSTSKSNLKYKLAQGRDTLKQLQASYSMTR